MQSAPDVDPGTRPVPCSQSTVAPVADSVGAVMVGLAATVVGFAFPAIGDHSAESIGYRNATFVIGGIGVLAYAVSAYHGFATATRCERYNPPDAGTAPAGADAAQASGSY
jgi:quinol-cytochrome oxidoreductase complex cytochrome b subunit